MNRKIRRIIRKFGYDIVPLDPKEVGKDPLNDMAKLLHNDHPLVFDVGANIGQSIQRFRSRFPRCIIHSFEPSPTTFATLSEQTAKRGDIHLWNCALGSVSGQMTFLENSHSDMSSFLTPSEFGWGEVTKETLVEVKTLDQFCHDENIEQIDILKSDTQGFDFEVFKGAESTIRAKKIGLIYFEIIFSDMYKDLPSFGQVYDFLTSRDFLLVSFYEFHYQKQLASWTDALFVQKSYNRAST
jgi:FkbM family methyltransferase